MSDPTENGPDWEELPDGTVIVRPAQIVRKHEEQRLVRMRYEAAQAELEAAKLRAAGLGEPTAETRAAGTHERNQDRPRRLPEYERHKAIWDAIALRWNQYHSYAKCRSLLIDKYPALLNRGPKGPTISDKTLKAIIEQGLRGDFKTDLS